MRTKLVKAAGKPVPRMENSRRVITDVPVEVPMNSYYTRRLMFGELVEVVAPDAEEK
jgi:hypothetical protein